MTSNDDDDDNDDGDDDDNNDDDDDGDKDKDQVCIGHIQHLLVLPPSSILSLPYCHLPLSTDGRWSWLQPLPP